MMMMMMIMMMMMMRRLVPEDAFEAARCRIWADKVNKECCSPYYTGESEAKCREGGACVPLICKHTHLRA